MTPAEQEARRLPVHPQIQEILDPINALGDMQPSGTVAERRAVAEMFTTAVFGAQQEPGPDVAAVDDRAIEVDGGTITLRVYTPPGAGPHPAHVYFHGGGFWLGTLDEYDDSSKHVCAGAGCVVVSTDYRLAPEHTFPTAAEDCYAALVWTAQHASELGVDPARISVGGASAGGNLAAVVTLMARDRGGPRVVFQVLDIPVTDLTMSQPSVTTNGEGYLLTKAAMEEFTRFYLPNADDARNPYASPLLAEDLGGLPPALVMTAEFDPLRDEGEAYAARLREAGVPTTHHRFDGHIHGSMSFTKALDSARAHRAEVIGALRAAYDGA